MYLKSVNVQGFKTFARRLELPFGRGVTAIVGPNGSGKSNFVDAIKWALGERNARGLRGERMEDVIYAGGPGKSSMGMAEVTLSIDNSDQRLPVEFAEIEVTRRLYRSGESEYFINGARARLRDIDALLASTGLRQDGYAVVAQNDIDYVIQAAPALRRELIEEAAGVRRLREQREEASRRLEEAERDMQRARDLLAELQPRAEELRVQAAAADEYRTVELQLKRLQGSLARDQWRKAKVQLRRTENRAHAARSKRDAAAAALAEFEPLYNAHRAELLNIREARWTHQQALADIRLRLTESEHRVRIVEERATAAEQALRLAQEDLRRLEESEHVEGSVVDELRRAVQSTAAEADEARGAARAAREAERQQRGAVAALDTQRATLQQDLVEAHRRRFGAEYEIQQLEGRVQFLDEQRRQAAAQWQTWTEQHTKLVAEAERLASRLAEADRELEEKQALVAGLEARFAESSQDVKAGEQAVTAIAANIQALEAEVAALRLLRDRTQHQSPVGLVPDLRLRRLLELIHVEERYRPAVEAVLEGCLHGWVAPEPEAAERAIALIAGSSVARETVLTEPIAVRPDPLPEHLVSIRKLVDAPGYLEPLLSHLLSGVALAHDLAEARQWIAQYPDLQVVTLDGELLTPFSYRGGRSPDAPLRVQAQIREAEEALGRTQQTLSLQRRELEERVARRGALLAERSAAAAQVDAARSAHAQLAAATTGARTEVDRHAQHGQELEQQLGRLAALIQEARREQSAVVEHLTSAAEAEAAINQSLRERDQELETANAQLSSWLEEWQEAELRAARAQQRHEDLVWQLARAEETWRSHGDELSQRRVAVQALEAQPVALEAERARGAEMVNELREELARLEQRELPGSAMLERLEAQVREDEQRNVTLQVQLAHAEDAAETAQREVEDAQAEVDRCAQALKDDATSVDDEELLTEADWQKTEREVARLQRRLEAIGAVNLLAPEEHAKLRDRCDSLGAQLSDLDAATSQLVELRQRLEDEIESRFRTVFQAVAVNFQEFFQELFEGGRAALRLETLPEVSPLDEGVEILAQTPGKRLQPLTLLSGGERALTALAFLFALQAVNPSPFYVLDEVDAALDDANVLRFNRVLKRLARDQQFVMVTHNHSTMAQAEVLYGVTLGEHGISRIVSVRLEEGTTMARLSERSA